MAIFYLVNFRVMEIRRQTWSTLNMTISIFCSVLLYGLVKKGVDMIAPHSPQWEVINTLLLYTVISVFTQVFLYFLKPKALRWWLLAAGTILAHVNGFAAMYGFAAVQAMPPISDSVLYSSLLVLFAALWLFGMELIGKWARLWIESWDDASVEDNEHWDEHVEEVENDVVSISLGFLLMQVVRFLITGRLCKFLPHDAPHDITQAQANLLGGAAFLFAVSTVLGTVLVHRVLSQEDPHSLVDRTVRAFQNVSAMAFAFCFLFWGEWQVYALGYHGVRIKACLLVAMFVTLLCLALIFALDAIEDLLGMRRAVRSLVLAMGLLIGFSWEKAFDIGLEALAHPDIPADAVFRGGGWFGDLLAFMARITAWFLPLFLLIVALPAWKMYVLPHCDPESIKAEEDEEDREDELASASTSARIKQELSRIGLV
jgi:hypothetical protein